MIGFTYENYTVTEGVDIFTDITVDIKSETKIEQSVIVRVSTQANSANGIFIQGSSSMWHTVVNMNEFLVS